MNEKMFCYQCQETAGCKGCTIVGVCGKKPEVAAMQDLLIYVTKGLSAVTTALRAAGKNVDRNVNHLVTVNLFTTITNANFDREAIIDRIKDYILGCKLPGAGGGGYLYMIAKDPGAARRIREILTRNPPNDKARFVEMVISMTGLQTSRS